MFLGVAGTLTEKTPAGANAQGRAKGTTLEQVAEEQAGFSWKKNCYC
jgi:hypothetical protein